MDRFAEYQAFVTVIDAGSFSKASERLGVAKSIVSRRVTQLEKRLGVQLLRRTTRSLSLTEAGRQFHERATRVLTDLDEAEESVSSAAAALRGRIRLAAPLSFGLHHLRDALCDFMRRHPSVDVDLDLNDREINLVEEGFDMAVRIGQLPDSTLVSRRLGTVRFVASASPAYLAAHGEPRAPQEISAHQGLHYANIPLSQAWRFERDGETETVLPQVRLRANNGDVLAEAAAAGLGIVYGPTFIASHHIAAGRLMPVLTGYRRPPLGLYALFPPGRLQPRRVRALTDFLVDRFGDLPAWDRVLAETGVASPK
jgi:DNA-binding transcriptional LysR family regulator